MHISAWQFTVQALEQLTCTTLLFPQKTVMVQPRQCVESDVKLNKSNQINEEMF